MFYIIKRVKPMINLTTSNSAMISWSIISGHIFCFLYFLYMFTDHLTVNTDGIHIVAEDVWGALRGLETLSQLVFCSRNTVVYQYWLHHGSIITLKLIKLKKGSYRIQYRQFVAVNLDKLSSRTILYTCSNELWTNSVPEQYNLKPC